MSFSKFTFIFFFSLTVCSISLGDFILFEDRIDAQQKTELRYDVPDGCVLTGLGFRAAYDNITTMHCRYNRLGPNGKLADPQEVQFGSEPNHACEAKVLLPDGWVAVGFGAAGEPEWDVTLLRVWARRLNADGTLGQMKTFSDGFKPDRGCEREIILTDPDRMMVGAGLRFHHNDIQGVYCRSKRIMNLDGRSRRNLRGFTGRGWVLDAEHVPNLDRLSRDIEKFRLKRIDLRYGKDLQVRGNKAIRALYELSVSARKQGVQSYVWFGTINRETARELFFMLPYLTGAVVDNSYQPSIEQTEQLLRMLYPICRKARRRLYLRLEEFPDSDHDKITSLIRSLPKNVGLIVPFDEYQFSENRSAALDTKVYGKRDITIEIDLTNCPAGPMLPDVRMNNLAALILKAASNGAKGFIVHANISDHYVPDTFNAVGLYALHRLPDDPFQPTDVLWSELCSMRYGAAAKQAMAALKLTESTNDLIFRMFGVPVLWDGRKISSMDIAERKLERFLDESSSAALKELLEPTDKTVERIRQDKETALWLISQSTASAGAAAKINPSAELRSLPQAMERLRMVTQFSQRVDHAYLLARVYAIDGAPVTRSSAEAALKSLREIDEQSSEMRDLVSMFKGTDAFIASVENWLRAHEKTAKLPRNFARIQGLINQRQDEAAVEALDELMRSDRFAPHLSKHNDTIGRLASSINALCEPSNTLRVVRGGDGQWILKKVAGRWGWTIEPKRPCIYLDMLAGPLNPPADYVISFEYFDKGDWKIHFHYDSDYPPEQKREYHPVEPLQLTDTGTWKNGSFVLTNCRFASSQNNSADMRFVSGTGACIRNIRLELK
ncbi:MAG: hypothetical protein ACYSSN_01705 [Planctomycetota bacterium]|jgi:hypothetical protein